MTASPMATESTYTTVGRSGRRRPVVIVPWCLGGFLVFVNLPAAELLPGRRNDHPVSGAFQGIEQIVRQTQRLVQTCARCRDVHEQPLERPEVLPVLNRAPMLEVRLGASNEAMRAGHRLCAATLRGGRSYCRPLSHWVLQCTVLGPDHLITGLSRRERGLGRRLADSKLRPVSPLRPRDPKDLAHPSHVASGDVKVAPPPWSSASTRPSHRALVGWSSRSGPING